MAKRTVRITLPKDKPERFISLMEKVVKHHESLGASSPLAGSSVIDMDKFKQVLTEAVEAREASITARGIAESKMHQAKSLLGTAAGQNINTEGTLYNMLDLIKKQLLIEYNSAPEEMSMFGFNVVVGTARFVGRPRKKKV